MKKTICFLIVPRYFLSRMENTNTITGAGNSAVQLNAERLASFAIFLQAKVDELTRKNTSLEEECNWLRSDLERLAIENRKLGNFCESVCV